MAKKIVILFLLFLSLSNTFAQDVSDGKKPKNKHWIVPSELYFMAGRYIHNTGNPQFSDYSTLIPQATESERYTYFFYLNVPDRSRVFTLNVGYNLNNKFGSLGKHMKLRLGLAYKESVQALYLWAQTPYQQQEIDHFVSPESGEQATLLLRRLDSKWSIYYYDQIIMDGSWIIRTGASRNLSIYGGLGFNIAYNFNSETLNISEFDYRFVFEHEENLFQTSHFGQNYNVYRHNRRIMPNGYTIAAFIPFGVDLRLGSRDNFWKRTGVFYEGRPGYIVQFLPEVRTITSTFFQHNVGVRLNLE